MHTLDNPKIFLFNTVLDIKRKTEFYNTIGGEEKSKTRVIICEQLKMIVANQINLVNGPLKLTKYYISFWSIYSPILQNGYQVFSTLLQFLIQCVAATVATNNFTCHLPHSHGVTLTYRREKKQTNRKRPRNFLIFLMPNISRQTFQSLMM